MKKSILTTLLLAILIIPTAAHAFTIFSFGGISFKLGAGQSINMFAAASSCSTSYANPGGTGNRTSTITLIQNGAFTIFNNTPANTIIDGDTASNGRQFFRNGLVLDGTTYWVTFDFGAGHTPTITESKWYQQDATAQGTWQWQGSNDNSTWTNLGSTFALTSSATTISTTMSANTGSYRYYRMLGISGTTSFAPWVYQMEFKICGY